MCNKSTISAIVVTYYSGPVLESCIKALLDEAEVLEIIIVDNGNTAIGQALIAAMATRSPRLRVLRPGRNLGFAAGCNLGAAAAQGMFLAFVNPDLVVSPGVFASVLAAFRQDPDAWLCGGRLLNPDGTEQRGGRRQVLTPWRALVEATGLWRLFPGHPYFARFNLHEEPILTEVREVPTVSGAFMVLPQERWRQLGGMDEALFLHVEDIELCLRVLKLGGKVLYCGTAPVHHRRSSSDVANCVLQWHKTRSMTRYFYKHFSDTYPRWSLHVFAVILWLRFGIAVLAGLPRDALRLRQKGCKPPGQGLTLGSA